MREKSGGKKKCDSKKSGEHCIVNSNYQLKLKILEYPGRITRFRSQIKIIHDLINFESKSASLNCIIVEIVQFRIKEKLKDLQQGCNLRIKCYTMVCVLTA